jgi:hypothetical protein
MIETLIGAGCYLAFWSNAGGVGPAARPLIFVCLALASLLAVATGKVRRIAATPIEILLYLIAVLSAAVSLIRAEEYCIYYTMYYLATLVLTSIVTRVVSTPRLMDLGAYVTILCLATSLALHANGLIAALKVSVGAYGLERFSALNNHPLLMGYIFGSGSILLARRVYLARAALERVLMAHRSRGLFALGDHRVDGGGRFRAAGRVSRASGTHGRARRRGGYRNRRSGRDLLLVCGRLPHPHPRARLGLTRFRKRRHR